MIDDIFRPLPDEARQNIAGLRQPEPFAGSDLPDWARTLITHHSLIDISVVELKSLGMTNVEQTDDGISLAYEGVRIDFTPGGQATANVAGPGESAESEKSEWMLPKITDYWDETVSAIAKAGQRFESMDERSRAAAMVEIAASVDRHVGVMNDELLMSAAVSFFDDLYKAASNIGWWDPHLQSYLMAFAATFSRALSQRRFTVQSLIDNSWDDPARLFELFPDWFRAAGIIFICPQALVRNLAERDGADPEAEAEPGGLEARYIEEARQVADTLMAQCQDEKRHFVLIDIDAVESSFDQPKKRAGKEGVLTIIRSEAPVQGSNVSVAPPKGISFRPD